MPIKTIDQQRLDSIFAEHHGRYGGRKEDYFALLYLTRKFKIDIDEIAHQVAFGGNDYVLQEVARGACGTATKLR
jgi:hypothetical protein